jgi:hypothetical protein
MSLLVRPRRLLAALLTTILALTVVSMTFAYIDRVLQARPFPGFAQIRELVDVNEEGGLAAWFSSGQLLLAALLLLGVAVAVARRGGKHVWYWRGLVVVFGYLSLDELVSLHEKTNSVTREALGLSGALYFGWVVVAAPILLVFALAYLRFVLALPARTRLLVIAAGVMFVTGALGFELVGAYIWDSGGAETMTYAVTNTIEELLEMVAIALFVYAIGAYQQQHLGLGLVDGGGATGAVPAGRASGAATVERTPAGSIRGA